MIHFFKGLAEKRPLAFWFLMYLIGVISVNTSILTLVLKQPLDMWAQSFFVLTIMMLLIVITKEVYEYDFQFHYSITNLFYCICPIAIALFFFFDYKIFSHLAHFSSQKSILLIFFSFCAAIFEETLFRSFLIGHMLYCWKDKKNILFTSSLISAFSFGIMHFLDLLHGAPVLSTLLQALFASSMSWLCAAVFIRSQCIWPSLTIHIFYDCLFFLQQYGKTGSTSHYSVRTLCVLLVVTIVHCAICMFLLRKDMNEELLELWDIEQ